VGAAIETAVARRYTRMKVDGAMGGDRLGVSLGKGHLVLQAVAANRALAAFERMIQRTISRG